MDLGLSRVVARSVLLLTGATLAAGTLWRLVADAVRTVAAEVAAGGPAALGRLPFDDALGAVCSLALLGCAGWLVAVTGLVCLDAVTAAAGRRPTATSRLGVRVCPRALHRLLLAGCGVALAAGLTAPTAIADPGSGSPVSGLTVPDRAVGVGTTTRSDRGISPPTEPGRGRAATPVVTVAGGDSLWSLAQQALGGRPNDAQTTRAWRTLYRANLERIGADPDLIFPGTALLIPDLERSWRKEPS